MASADGTAVMLFTRDLRIQDNRALNHALRRYRRVVAVFCFDPAQIDPGRNRYRSARAIAFMTRSVVCLSRALGPGRLHCFHASPETALQRIRRHRRIDAVVVSRDYTRFSRERARRLGATEIENHMLQPGVLNRAGQTYRVFTPYYRRARELDAIPAIQRLPRGARQRIVGPMDIGSLLPVEDYDALLRIVAPDCLGVTSRLRGGRSEGLRLLRRLPRRYRDTRDDPSERTSCLSPHHKFGTVSTRETYRAIQQHLQNPHREALTRQLYWRDFYYCIADAFPRVFGEPFQTKYRGVRWSRSRADFEQWCRGRTGVPIVDAGMRQLNTEGWMHNRLRMIVASFLTKDLRIDWRRGERYFAQQLVDYDPAQNNGGWQWCAGTGTDAQPYFRILNPWRQGRRFDPEGRYIRRYVPELRAMDPRQLHDPRYHQPMVDHREASGAALQMYRDAIEQAN